MKPTQLSRAAMGQYQTFTAFTEEREAEKFRDELQKKGIDAITAKQRLFLRDAAGAPVEVVEVHVAAAHFREACNHISDGNRPKLPRQFSLRAVLILMTIMCVLSALTHHFGLVKTFWGTVWLSMGGIGLGYALVVLHRGRASLGWRHTHGTVVQSYVDWSRENYYLPEIHYRFHANDREYVVNIVSYRSIYIVRGRPGHELARRGVVKYPIGLEVDVFHDPADPSHAVLERGGRLRDVCLPAAIGIMFITIGFLILFGIMR